MGKTNALILVDIQNDYFTGGLWPVEDMERTAAQAAAVLQKTRAESEMVVHIYHEAASDAAPFFRPGTLGGVSLSAEQVQAAFLGPLAMSYATVI